MLLSQTTQLVGVERDPRRGRLPPQFGFNGTGGGKPVPQFPSSGEPNQEDIVLDPVNRDLVHRPGLVTSAPACRCRNPPSDP